MVYLIQRMVNRMKTTLNIDDHVMKRLKEEAARRNTTMSELVEAGLRRILGSDGVDKRGKKLPRLPSWSSGGSLVDVANRDQLYAIMEDD
jgi:Ribbon-helix-helix protein, copG family